MDILRVIAASRGSVCKGRKGYSSFGLRCVFVVQKSLKLSIRSFCCSFLSCIALDHICSAVCRCHTGGCWLTAAAMLSWSPHHLSASCGLLAQCWKIRVEHIGRVCMYYVCLLSIRVCLVVFQSARFLAHVDVWSDSSRELGCTQIIAMVAHKVVGWFLQAISVPCHFEQPCRDSGYKVVTKARILGWFTFHSHTCKDRGAANQRELLDFDEIVLLLLCAFVSGKTISMF